MCKPNNKLERYLDVHRDKIIHFIRSKVNDANYAEDLLQDSALKALNSYKSVRDESKVISWFYQILRNKIIDYYRKQGQNTRQDDLLPEDMLLYELPDDQEEQDNPCRCYQKVLPVMNADYASIISKLELGNESPESVSRELGITRNNLKVKRHRARLQLKKLLLDKCGSCAENGCANCTCY